MNINNKTKSDVLTFEQPAFDSDDTVLWVVKRADERCGRPTVVRVVGRMSNRLGTEQHIKTYFGVIKAILGADLPVTAGKNEVMR